MTLIFPPDHLRRAFYRSGKLLFKNSTAAELINTETKIVISEFLLLVWEESHCRVGSETLQGVGYAQGSALSAVRFRLRPVSRHNSSGLTRGCAYMGKGRKR